MAAAGNICAADCTRTRFGVLADGREVEAITLSNGRGMTARVLTLGATLQSLCVPDRAGRLADVVLGYDDAESYLHNPDFFGATIGRYCNRISRGQFELAGRRYQLPLNNGVNSLHGGTTGLGKVLWSVGRLTRGATSGVELLHESAAGADGYPGTLSVTASFELDADGALGITYRATTDAPTIVNLTNHSYFNLGGENSARGIEAQVLTIPADSYLPVDETLIPTGELRSVQGTPFDFRKPKLIGAALHAERNATGEKQIVAADAQLDPQLVPGRGYDHNWIIGRAPVATPRLMARLEDPESGRTLEVLSNQPGLQFYSGNFLNGTQRGKSGRAYEYRHGLALEPQLFPDTPNQPAFGSARLLPGAVYEHRIVFRLRTTH